MIETLNIIYYSLISGILSGCISHFIGDGCNIVLGLFYTHRYYVSSGLDQSTCDACMKMIKNTCVYSSSKIETSRESIPHGCILGRVDNSKRKFTSRLISLIRSWLPIDYIAYVSIQENNSYGHSNQAKDITMYIYTNVNISHWSTKQETSNTDSSKGAKDVDDRASNVESCPKSPTCSMKRTVQVYRRYSPWKGNGYKTYESSYHLDYVTPQQLTVIEEIERMTQNSQKNHFSSSGVFLISGPVGTGKSMVGRILADRLSAALCDDFNPTEPGVNLYHLIQEIEPSQERPLVIVMDEVDQLIEAFMQNRIEDHRYMTTEVRDVQTWNQFMDHIHDIHHVIVILTSNVSKDWFKRKHESLIRPGRVHACFTLEASNAWMEQILNARFSNPRTKNNTS